MSQSIDNIKIKQGSANDEPTARKERMIADAEKLVHKRRHLEEEELKKLTGELISIYDNVFNGNNLRERAAHIVSSLAKRYDLVLDLVIENARRYAETQHIDDAFPYSPNSFNVLAKLGKGNLRVISFLKHTVQYDWGIPRWEATGVLCELNDPLADRIIIDVIQEKYQPRFLDLQSDLRKIEEVKGRSFVERHRS